MEPAARQFVDNAKTAGHVVLDSGWKHDSGNKYMADVAVVVPSGQAVNLQ